MYKSLIYSTNYIVLIKLKIYIYNADANVCKLKSALTKENNYKLEIAREEFMERQKRKVIVTKWRKIRKKLVYQVKKSEIIKVILKIIQIQTKSITNIYFNFKNYKV